MRMNEQEKPIYSEIIVIIRTNTFNKEQRTASLRNKIWNIIFKKAKCSIHQLNTFWKNVSTVTDSSSNSILVCIHWYPRVYVCSGNQHKYTRSNLILQHAERFISSITTSTQHCRCRMQPQLRLPITMHSYAISDFWLLVFHPEFSALPVCHFILCCHF